MLANWVKTAIDKAGISQAELARQMTARLRRSIDRAAVQKMTVGRRAVSGDEMLAIADVTGVQPPVDADSKTVTIPILSFVQAGSFVERDGVSLLDDFPSLPIAGLPDGEWYAFEVEGDSMDRISPPGSIIVANRRQRQLVQNACYIVLDENGAGTYKRFRANPRRLEPVSTNPSHEPMFLDENDMPRVFGRVMMSILRM